MLHISRPRTSLRRKKGVGHSILYIEKQPQRWDSQAKRTIFLLHEQMAKSLLDPMSRNQHLWSILSYQAAMIKQEDGMWSPIQAKLSTGPRCMESVEQGKSMSKAEQALITIRFIILLCAPDRVSVDGRYASRDAKRFGCGGIAR
eukprot:scpid84733/ scgid23582/ 